jgi:hypothetical protein
MRERRTSVPTRLATVLLVVSSTLTWAPHLDAEPVVVRYAEGVARGFPVVRSLSGDKLAQGEFAQVPAGDRIESRLVFRFADGSLYDKFQGPLYFMGPVWRIDPSP